MDNVEQENSQWLQHNLSSDFFSAMENQPKALALLSQNLDFLVQNQRMILADNDKLMMQATLQQQHSLRDILQQIPERDLSYALIVNSEDKLPGATLPLEFQYFEFARKSNQEISSDLVEIPRAIAEPIVAAFAQKYAMLDQYQGRCNLSSLWQNNQRYIERTKAADVAAMLAIYQRSTEDGGLCLEILDQGDGADTCIYFAVANPPLKDFYLQIVEVFRRLDLPLKQMSCLTISNGSHPYFLGRFDLCSTRSADLTENSTLLKRLRLELYTLQIVGAHSQTYAQLVANGILTGVDASLVNAFISFSHTNLAHNQPDRFGIDDVRNAFYSHPNIVQQLVQLFRLRFDPDILEREQSYQEQLKQVTQTLEDYNSGHRYLDEIRKAVFHCCLLFIRYTLKTNFFVLEKQALAFRLDSAYLAELGQNYTADLPVATPFRVTFFMSRFGFGYHMGFSDIARGGWRTVIAQSQDDLVTNAMVLFRENFVLAHTQHLKNKDIYQGGSKMVLIMDASDLHNEDSQLKTWRLHKLQSAVINAFLDIFITKDGVVTHPQVIDYYREDEPIELGPDENMHDVMIEAIAEISKQRGYLLGSAIMSSKKVGINHKEYGVTSTGVIKFAEIAMRELGIDVHKEPFAVKLTGGPSGDVAGNAIRLLMERCPQVSIRLILDGSGALYDPAGADHNELKGLLLREDVASFNPTALTPGGYILYRNSTRQEGFRELYRKVTNDDGQIKEEWLSIDEFSSLYAALVFSVEADLFIPAGGRPETIDDSNWRQFLLADGRPSAKVIVEGANSYITPQARLELQREGVLLLRDAAANKCGVISSSYEIIANLLFSDEEFLAEKDRYVTDVLEILETVAEYEAKLILKRRRDHPQRFCSEISDEISLEINAHYARIFKFFCDSPDLCNTKLYRRAIIGHLPVMVQQSPDYRKRIDKLPQKYLFAILAAEIASSMVYRNNQKTAFEDEVQMHINRYFPGEGEGISHHLYRQAF
jgi:glutamate dehydrogenase